jgi:perosamine synthetase
MMSDAHIPVFKPNYDEQELEALRPVLASGWIGLGPKVAEFEQRFAEYVGAKHAVAVNSATAGLHLALAALGIKSGDEVLVPSLTFVSTVHAVEYLGARPVFCDIEPDTLIMNFQDAAGKLTERTKVVVPVDYGGHSHDVKACYRYLGSGGVAVLTDAAHACGSQYVWSMGGKEYSARVGSISSLTVFSFHAVKNLATGDGGMITTIHPEIAERLRRLRWMGIDKSTYDRSSTAYSWQYDVTELGFKCHMNDIAATLGLVQLEKLEKANERRRQIAAMYDVGLDDVDWLECPVVKPYTQTAQHNYVIKTSYRDGLNLHLKGLNIATGVHYMPVHMMSYYRAKYGPQHLPITETVWPTLLTLPVYPAMTEEDVDRVIDGIHSFKAAA